MFSRRFTDSSNISNNNLANLNINKTEFFDAINNEEEEKIRDLLNDHNLNIWQIRDGNGYTILHRSTFKNNYKLTLEIIEEVKKRLGLGSTNKMENFMNEKTNEGLTALHYASSNGNIKMMQLLKQYGAKIEAITNTGKNVLHIAAENNQPSMIIYCVMNEPLDIFSVDENGSTPLHLACYSGSFECVNYLLSLNSDINAIDKEKYTPLHLAVIKEREKIVKLLLKKGADKNMKSNKNELPIDIAKNKNYLNIVKILSDKEINPLFTLEFPNGYIEPTDIYKKVIFFMLVIPEIIIFFLIIPFVEDMNHIYVSLGFLFICLLTYIIIIYKNPGYQKNDNFIKESQGEKKYQALSKLIEDGVDLKKYCPICYVDNTDNDNIKHCYICNKCVLELSHHCFWLNKCIGKKNKCSYLTFIFFTFFYAIYAIFISSYLLSDSVYISYEKKFPFSWLNYIDIDRGFRVLGANIVAIFGFIVSFPLFILFMLEIFKSCGLLMRKRDLDNNMDENERSENEPLIDNSINDINNDKETIEINNTLKIPNETFPIIDGRDSNINNE